MSHPILDELLSDRPGLALCWLGNIGWLVAHRSRLVAFDLDLDSPERLAPPPVKTDELAPALEVLFITHEHGDHFNDATAGMLARHSRCLFVLPTSCLEKAKRLGLPEDRIRVARPRQPFDLDRMHVEPLRAIHGDRHLAVCDQANLDDCGYVLTLDDLRLLQPGDSLLTRNHLLQHAIDILFVSPTEHNMHVQPARTLIETLRPRHVFPQHFDTYVQTPDNAFWTRGYPDELRQALDPEMSARYHKLRQGEVYVLGAEHHA